MMVMICNNEDDEEDCYHHYHYLQSSLLHFIVITMSRHPLVSLMLFTISIIITYHYILSPSLSLVDILIFTVTVVTMIISLFIIIMYTMMIMIVMMPHMLVMIHRCLGLRHISTYNFGLPNSPALQLVACQPVCSFCSRTFFQKGLESLNGSAKWSAANQYSLMACNINSCRTHIKKNIAFLGGEEHGEKMETR